MPIYRTIVKTYNVIFQSQGIIWFLDGNHVQWDYKNIVKRKGEL